MRPNASRSPVRRSIRAAEHKTARDDDGKRIKTGERLRPATATREAMSGIDLVTLAAMLEHAKINMVLRCAHLKQDHQSSAMDRLQEYNAMEQIRAFGRVQASPQ